MDRWFLKDGVVCFKSEDAEINGWSLAGLVACLNKRDKTIADLEAKLAESEARIKDLEFRNKNLEHSLSVAPNANAGQRARIVELKGINHQLKQQLADALKDFNDIQEENDELAQQLQEEKNRNKKLNHEAQKYYEDAYCNDFQNQKAIAELEKVKEYNRGLVYSSSLIDKFIDQQIKSLKGGNNNVNVCNKMSYM